VPVVRRAAAFLVLAALAAAAPASASAHPVAAQLQDAVAAQRLTPAEAAQVWSLYGEGRAPSANGTERAASDVTLRSARAGQLGLNAHQALWGLQASAGQRQVLQGRQVVPGTRIEVRLYSGAWWPHQLGTWAWLGAAASDPKTKPATLQSWWAQASLLLTPGSGGTIQAATLNPFASKQTGWTSAMTQATAARTLQRLSIRVADPALAAESSQLLNLVSPAGGLMVDGRPLLYSDDPDQIVANAHAQTLLAVSQIADADPAAAPLAAQLNATLKADLPGYLKPGWSLYSLGGPYAPLNYQQLMADLTAQLCQRQLGAEYCAAAQRLTAEIGAPPTLRVVAIGKLRHGARRVVVALSHPGQLRVAAKRAAGFGHVAQLAAHPGRNTVAVMWPKDAHEVSVSFLSIQGTNLSQRVPLAR
jgi:D-glucuronyl C5-epimerase C-terminus